MNSGTGPGTITLDGCSVELYSLLGPTGEAEIIDAAIAPKCTVLELGCGAGRITHQLVDLGHTVTAVDQSRERLRVLGAEAEHDRVEGPV